MERRAAGEGLAARRGLPADAWSVEQGRKLEKENIRNNDMPRHI